MCGVCVCVCGVCVLISYQEPRLRKKKSVNFPPKQIEFTLLHMLSFKTIDFRVFGAVFHCAVSSFVSCCINAH